MNRPSKFMNSGFKGDVEGAAPSTYLLTAGQPGHLPVQVVFPDPVLKLGSGLNTKVSYPSKI